MSGEEGLDIKSFGRLSQQRADSDGIASCLRYPVVQVMRQDAAGLPRYGMLHDDGSP